MSTKYLLFVFDPAYTFTALNLALVELLFRLRGEVYFHALNMRENRARGKLGESRSIPEDR
jgi:hypothetical protein